MPPRWMWPFDQELEAWFERVDEERKAKFNKGASAGSSESEGSMIQNEYAKGRG